MGKFKFKKLGLNMLPKGYYLGTWSYMKRKRVPITWCIMSERLWKMFAGFYGLDIGKGRCVDVVFTGAYRWSCMRFLYVKVKGYCFSKIIMIMVTILQHY